MTKTDMIIKYMGITAYLDMMKKDFEDKIKHCSSGINYYATELAKILGKKKKKSFSSEKIYEDSLNIYATQMAAFNKALADITKMTQSLMEILAENKDKEEIPDDIFDKVFEALSIK